MRLIIITHEGNNIQKQFFFLEVGAKKAYFDKNLLTQMRNMLLVKDDRAWNV